MPALRGDCTRKEDEEDGEGGGVGSKEEEEAAEVGAGCSGGGTDGGRAAQAGRLAFVRYTLGRTPGAAPSPALALSPDLGDTSLVVVAAPRLLLLLLLLLLPLSGLLSGLLNGLLRCGGSKTGVGAGAGCRIEVLTMPLTEVAVPTWRDRAKSEDDEEDGSSSCPLVVEVLVGARGPDPVVGAP